MIREKIEKIVSQFAPEDTKFSINHPPKREYGDYSIFFPLEIAKNIKLKIERKPPSFLDKVQLVSPGFLNFYLKSDFLQKQIKKIIKDKENFGRLNLGKGEKINIEFISANPTGPLHIGNGRGAFWGDVLANILEYSGFKVIREYYINNSKSSSQIKELGKTALGKGKSYQTKELKKIIQKIKSKLSKIKSESEAGFILARELQKENQKFIEKKLKIKFDIWFEEESLFKKSEIKKIISFLKNKNLIYKKDGALWLKTSRFDNLKDEVLIRKDGNPAYFLSDIAYHKDKIQRGFKKIIDIWGADHQGHIKRMEAAIKILNFKGEFRVFISQMVILKGGKKLSKRRGDLILLEDLVEEVGLDICKYFYLSKSLSTQMEFDLELAKKQSEKNPVYYIQYAYARICSILRKLEKFKISTSHQLVQRIMTENLKLLKHPSELKLIKQLVRFPEMIEDIARNFELHRLCEFVYDLANIFNQFYRDCRVLPNVKKQKIQKKSKEINNNLIKARVNLVIATKIVLENSMKILGISLPKKM